MRRGLLRVLIVAAAGGVSSQAGAWLLYPDDEKPERIIVEIERAFGEVVPLKALPPPFNSALQTAQGPDTLSFRWRYNPRAQGMAFLRVNAAGDGVLTFRFAVHPVLEGERFGAAAVMVGQDGRALHSFYARADVGEDTGRATARRGAVMALSRPPDWWRRVDGIHFFFMHYHPVQKLDDAGSWRAMQTAVRRITKGEGSEQRVIAGE